MVMSDASVCFFLVNRLVRTRMLGGVGAGGENPPATLLYARHGCELMG